MAHYNENIVDIDLNSGTIHRSFVGKIVGEGDNNANRYGVNVLRDGNPVDLTGASVVGFFIRPNGDTVVINGGSVSGSVAYVTLPQSCYVYEGQFTLAIKLVTGNDITGTVRIVDGTIVNTTTETQIDPGSVIPSIAELLAIIDDAETAAAAANEAAETAAAAATEAVETANAAAANAANQVNSFADGVYKQEKKNYAYVSDGYKLLDSGLSAADSDYEIQKYSARPGEILHIIAKHKAQFQEGGNVPSTGDPDRIGPTYSEADIFVEVPEGADWLMLSVKKNTTGSGVYACRKKEIIASGLSVYDFEKGNVANGADDTWHASSRIRTPVLKMIDDVSVRCTGGAAFFVDYLDQDGNFTHTSSWQEGVYTIQHGSICRVCMAYTKDDTEERTAIQIFSRFTIGCNAIFDITSQKDLNRLLERGSILSNGNDDNDFRYGVRCRTKGVCYSKHNIVVRKVGGAYQIVWYNASGEKTGYKGWLTTDFVIPAWTYWRLLIDADPSADNDTTYPFDYVMSRVQLDCKPIYEYSSNPNIIWQCRDVDDTSYPPHSKAAIRAAAENQYDRVKICCRQTTDGYFVAVHDNTINNLARNTDGTAISTTIYTDECSLATLNSYDWGIKYGEQYAGMGVPLVSDALKYAAMYGLGVTIEFYYYPTDAKKNELLAILEQYGLVENLIIVTSNLMHFDSMNYWKNKNDKISFFIGGTYAQISAAVSEINALKTGNNTIYVEPMPFQTVPDASFRSLAIENGWRLYSSGALSESDLFNTVGINHGFTLISVGNVYMIKDSVRRWANSQS